MRHGGMVSRGRWDMRWWWFSLTDILIHIIHLEYIHTCTHFGEGEIPQLHRRSFVFFFFLTYTYICSYTHICTYKHTHIYTYIYIYIHIHSHIHIYTHTHTWTYISPWPCTLRWGGDTPAAPFTYYLAYLGEGEIPRLHPMHIFSELCTLRWGGDTPAAP